MKLYLLTREKENEGWDEVYGFVIAAKSSIAARKLAGDNKGDEGKEVWLDKAETKCQVIANESKYKKEEMVLCDFLSG